MLAHYVPVHQFKDLETSLKYYTKNDEFEVAQANISEIRNIISTKADKDALFNKEREIVTYTNKKLQDYLQVSLYNAQTDILKAEIKGIISKIATASDDLDNIKSYSDIIDAKLERKLEIDDFNEEVQEIWNEFPKYTSYENIRILAEKLGKF